MTKTLHRPSDHGEIRQLAIFRTPPSRIDDRLETAMCCLRGLSTLIGSRSDRQLEVDPSDLADLLDMIGREIEAIYGAMGEVQ